MLKNFLKTLTKNRNEFHKNKFILNKVKSHSFSSEDNNYNQDKKRVKLSELISDKKEDEKIIKTMKKSDSYLKKLAEKNKNKSDSNEHLDDNIKLKGNISDKENTTKKPIILKAAKFPFQNTNYNKKSELNSEDDLDNIYNTQDNEIKNINKKNSFRDNENSSNKVGFKTIKVPKRTYKNKDYDSDNIIDFDKENIFKAENENNDQNKDIKENKDENSDEEILRYMCLPLNMQKMEDVKFKWQQFFISSQRVIPDINRAINNKPDSVYYEYIRDLIDEFTDKQLLFALKNILINEDIIKGYEMQFILRDLFFRLKSHGTFDLSSKVNIVMLYEIFFLFDLIEYKLKSDENSINTIAGYFLQMIIMIIDYQRFFFPEFKIEENIMILKSMIDKNVVDVYLIKKFLKQYSELDIVNTLKDCVYKIKYFNTEYNLNLSIFYILDNYVKICKINNEYESINDQKFKFLVKRLFTEFLNMIKDDKILLSDITFNSFQYDNLISIFPLEQREIYIQSINNALISKIYKELKLISEDKILITDGRTITQSVNLVRRIKKNTCKDNLFRETYLLLSDLIYENYTLSLLSELNDEAKFDDSHNSAILLIYDTWIDGLIQSAIENEICDFNILEPFMILLLTRIQKYRLESNNTFLIKKLYYLGKYNFNDILQSEKFNSITLKNYFKILDELRNFLPKYLEQIKNNFKTAISSNKFNSNHSLLNLDKESYEILDKFYSNLFQKELIKIESNNFGLHYEDDYGLSNSVNPYLMRFKIIPKEMYMVSYLPRYCKTLTQELRTDLNKDIIIDHCKLVFGFIRAAIIYNVFTIKLANNFINFIITIYSDKSEIFSKYLLEDIDLYKDFNFILNHIINPEDNFIIKDYENVKNKKAKKQNKSSDQEDDSDMNLDFLQNLYINEETLFKKLNEKFDINKYDIKEKEDFDIHSYKINMLMFKDAITEYIDENEELQIFFDKYLEEKKLNKNSYTNFSNSHSNFINLFKLQGENMIDNEEEFNFYNDENIKNNRIPSEEKNKYITNASTKNKKPTSPQDLYYDVNQIKTFSNIKSMIVNSDTIQDYQIEGLLNDEILFLKIFLDLKKISFLINEITKRVSIKELNSYFESFNNHDFLFSSPIYDEIKKINTEISETALNLSIYSSFDIARSNIYYNFLKDFIDSNNKSIHKKNLPITNQDKEDLVLINYPIFPMIIPFIIQKIDPKTQDRKIDVYQKANFYKCSSNPIRSQKSYDNLLFLKSILRNQEKNINIYEYNNLI